MLFFFREYRVRQRNVSQILYGSPYNGTIQPNIVVEIAGNGSCYFFIVNLRYVS